MKDIARERDNVKNIIMNICKRAVYYGDVSSRGFQKKVLTKMKQQQFREINRTFYFIHKFIANNFISFVISRTDAVSNIKFYKQK